MARANKVSLLLAWLAVLGLSGGLGAEAARLGRIAGEGEETAEEDKALVTEIQECVDSIRKPNGEPGVVRMVFTTTDGFFEADKDMSAAGCFFNMAREAFNMAIGDDDEDVQVQVDLATGSNDWSRVNRETLMRMLHFAHSKLKAAGFDVAKVEFSKIARPVKSDLIEANVLSEDATFIDEVAQNEKLFSLVTAAHFMDFPELYQLCTAKIASMIWGKTEQEIQGTLTSQS